MEGGELPDSQKQPLLSDSHQACGHPNKHLASESRDALGLASAWRSGVKARHVSINHDAGSSSISLGCPDLQTSKICSSISRKCASVLMWD
jgi:hypothetical protein